MHEIILAASNWIIEIITALGYKGIFIGMMIESASIPLPSEAIMGFAGFLVYKGQMNLWLAGLVGALGNITGSTIMYLIGIKGGRPFIKKYGHYLHIHEDRFNQVDKWFAKWGDELVFVSQLLPIVRTFISLPAGILKVNFPKFIIYTFTGAFIWCTSLAYISFRLGDQWERLGASLEKLQFVVLGVVGLGIIYIVYRYTKHLFKPHNR
ncbi:MAG TPA: DedA family protein [bacterium]|nr:DedA family protein [bacterium]